MLDLSQADGPRQLAFEDDVHQVPPRLFPRSLRVEIVGLAIELRLVRIGLAGHGGGSDDAGDLGVRVVEQHLVADFHAITHEVAGLVVAHAVPRLGPDAFEVVDGECVGFGLHQPVSAPLAHQSGVLRVKVWVASSVQTASTCTSHGSGASASTCCAANAAPTRNGGGLPACRNAKLRSYQPPPMPRRWPWRSNPTSGITTSAIADGGSSSPGGTSG